MWNVHEQHHDSKNNPHCMVGKPSQNQMPDKESIRGLLGQFCDRRQPANTQGVDVVLLTIQGMMGSLNWSREEWRANMAEVDSMMSSMDAKLKNKHTFQ